MKKHILILIGILCLQSCVVTRGINYGNASVDDYSIFEQDTVARGLQTFRFADAQQKRAHLQSSVFKLSKDLIDSIHEEGIVAYTS